MELSVEPSIQHGRIVRSLFYGLAATADIILRDIMIFIRTRQNKEPAMKMTKWTPQSEPVLKTCCIGHVQ